MTANGPKQLLPGFRILAAISLFIWLAAVGICSAHCSFGFLNADSKNPRHCCQHKEGKQPTAKSSCLVNISLKASEKAAIHVEPEFHLAYLRTPLALLEESLFTQTLISPFRHGSPTDSFTVPEVYLGAAHFSLAPPFQS